MAYPNKPLVNYDESEEIYTFTYTGGHLPKGDVRYIFINSLNISNELPSCSPMDQQKYWPTFSPASYPSDSHN